VLWLLTVVVLLGPIFAPRLKSVIAEGSDPPR
jgi:hypothetical protein